MQTELRVLVVVVLISLAGGNVDDFSEDALKEMGLIHPNVLDLKAKFINSHFPMELHKPEIIDGDTIIFEPKSIPNQASAFKHRLCGEFHGIDINEGGETFCRLKRFGFRVTKSDNDAKTYIEFIVIIQSPDSKKGLLLDVPVLKIPAKYVTENNKQLQTWARDARVGIYSPIDCLQLDKAFHVESIILYFDWLAELLDYGIRDTGLYDREMDVYAARPIVVAETAINSLIKVAENFLKKNVRKNPIFSRSFLHTVSHGYA